MENDIGKTSWKKNVFSHTANNPDIEFTTLNMINKIKNVAKKKKRKKKEFNYKNIETFENIHESIKEGVIDGSHSGDLNSNGKWVDSDGNTESGYFDPSDGSYWVTDSSGVKRKYDGPLDPESGIPLTPDFWEGLDSGDHGAKKDDPRPAIIAFIDLIHKKINDFNESKARLIANALQQSTASNHDVNLIQPYLSLVESAFFAYFFAYNLMYVTLYFDNEGNKVKFPKIHSNTIKNMTLDKGLGIFMQPVVFFLTYSIYFTDILQFWLLEKIPSIFKTVFNAPLFMMVAFVGMIFLIENVTGWFIQFMKDVIMLNTDNVFVNIMYFAVLFYFVSDCFNFIKFDIPKYSFSVMMDLMSHPIISLLLGILQFIIVVMISVPLGALFCIIILFLITFSILWVPFTTMSFQKIMNIPYIPFEINEFLHKSFLLNFDPNAKGVTFSQKVQFAFTLIFDFICSYMFLITILVIMAVSISDYNLHMQNADLKKNLNTINIALTCGLGLFLVGGFFGKISEKREIDPSMVMDALPDATEASEENPFADLAKNALPPGMNPDNIAKGMLPPGMDPSKLSEMASMNPVKAAKGMLPPGMDPSKLSELSKGLNDPTALAGLAGVVPPINIPDLANAKGDFTKGLVSSIGADNLSEFKQGMNATYENSSDSDDDSDDDSEDDSTSESDDDSTSESDDDSEDDSKSDSVDESDDEAKKKDTVTDKPETDKEDSDKEDSDKEDSGEDDSGEDDSDEEPIELEKKNLEEEKE